MSKTTNGSGEPNNASSQAAADVSNTGGGDDITTLTAKIAELTEGSTALNRELSDLRNQLATKEKELTKWQKKGRAHDDNIDKKANDGDASAWEAKMQAQREEFADKEDGYKSTIRNLESELKQDRVVARSLSKAAEYFTAEALPIIKMHVERDLDWQDGEVVIKDANGEVRYSGRAKTSLEEYFSELASRFPFMTRPKGQAGGDTGGRKTTPSASHGKGYTPEELMRLSPQQQNDRIREGDVDSARNFLRAISGGAR